MNKFLSIALPVIVIVVLFTAYSFIRNKFFPVQRETVMTEGMKITARTSLGTIEIGAGRGFERTYTWNGCTRSLTMDPREERWYGSYGIYYPGMGNHWKDCNGITRAVVEEGQQQLENVEQALDFIDTRTTLGTVAVYTNDGLVVVWGLTPERSQLDAEVWQIFINGNKPTQLAGAQDDAITITSELK